jgi:uncharacterized OB-fold protein
VTVTGGGMAPRGKYVPPADGLHAEFFVRAAGGQLHLQRCSDCGLFRQPPAYYCASCSSSEWTWTPSSGEGSLFSWTVSHRPYDTAWTNDTPWVTSIIELDEGPRLVGWLRDVDPTELALGQRLVVRPEPVTDDFTFLRLGPAPAVPEPG